MHSSKNKIGSSNFEYWLLRRYVWKFIYRYFKADIILDVIEVYLRDGRNFILNEAISLN